MNTKVVRIKEEEKTRETLEKNPGLLEAAEILKNGGLVAFPTETVYRLISSEFNMDTACVELKFRDSSMIAIDTIAVENEVADNMYQRSELDYLIYNDPIGYADLILNGDPEIYLKTVTEYKPLD